MRCSRSRVAPAAMAMFAAALSVRVPAFAHEPTADAARPFASSANRGRPEVHLDRLDFPADAPAAAYFKKRLRRILRREARRADWGVGRGHRIEYRFAVTELTLEREHDVLRVRCSARGKLPGGKAASSKLQFGGNPHQRNRVVERVLEIVARGVVTRLAELERVRRGDLERSRVRKPSP